MYEYFYRLFHGYSTTKIFQKNIAVFLLRYKSQILHITPEAKRWISWYEQQEILEVLCVLRDKVGAPEEFISEAFLNFKKQKWDLRESGMMHTNVLTPLVLKEDVCADTQILLVHHIASTYFLGKRIQKGKFCLKGHPC